MMNKWHHVLSRSCMLYKHDPDFADDEDVTESGMNFGAGFEDPGHPGFMSDQENIPDEFFKDVFAGKFPPGVKVDWNGSESTHYVTASMPYTVGDAMEIIRSVLLPLGFTEIPN